MVVPPRCALRHAVIAPPDPDLVVERTSLAGNTADIISMSMSLLRLTSLKLIDTGITSRGLDFLIDHLPDSLDDLTLTQTPCVSDKKTFVKLLKKLQNIKSLSLVGCNLNHTHTLRLASTPNNKLTSLDLSGNQFGKDGGEVLYDMLSSNPKIISLKIEECGIKKKLAKRIDDKLRYNNSFLNQLFSQEVSLSILDSMKMIDDNISSMFSDTSFS